VEGPNVTGRPAKYAVDGLSVAVPLFNPTGGTAAQVEHVVFATNRLIVDPTVGETGTS
jgi:hypothetical protein